MSWTSHVWGKGIPPKIAIFIWKIFLQIVPTEDVIQRMDISLASKCVCCSRRFQRETTRHLLFKSDWAKVFWQRMSTIFDRQMTHGIHSFERNWMRSKSTWDRFAFSMACCGIWEIWKTRNAICHDGPARSWEYTWLHWAPRIISTLKKFHIRSFQQAHTLVCLNVNHLTPTRSRTTWNAWQPNEYGLTMNVAFLHMAGSIKAGMIVRNSRGGFVLALVSNVLRDVHQHELFAFLHTCRPHLRFPIKTIQGSHHIFESLAHGDQRLHPDMIGDWRRCLHDFPNTQFIRVCPGKNITASAIVSTCNMGIMRASSDLHIAAIQALRADSSKIPHVCSRRCTISLMPITEDDSRIASRDTYVPRVFLDDTFI